MAFPYLILLRSVQYQRWPRESRDIRYLQICVQTRRGRGGDLKLRRRNRSLSAGEEGAALTALLRGEGGKGAFIKSGGNWGSSGYLYPTTLQSIFPDAC